MSGTIGPGIGSRFALPIAQIVDQQGVPLVGATVTFYATGTSTLQSVYSDPLLTTALSNPITANSWGMFPQSFMIPSPAYRVVLKDPAGAVIYDCDPVSGIPISGFGNYVPGSVPVGAIQPYGGTTPPSHWMWCDGSEVSRTTFPSLFAVLGTQFGAGDGATTFALPDLRGCVPAGADGMGGIAAGRLTFGGSGVNGNTIGAIGGSELLQTHNHSLNDPGHTHTDAGHTHPVGSDTSDPQGYPLTGGGLQGGGSYFYHFDHVVIKQGNAAIQSASTGITESNAGGGANQNVQPTVIVGYIIYTG